MPYYTTDSILGKVYYVNDKFPYDIIYHIKNYFHLWDWVKPERVDVSIKDYGDLMNLKETTEPCPYYRHGFMYNSQSGCFLFHIVPTNEVIHATINSFVGIYHLYRKVTPDEYESIKDTLPKADFTIRDSVIRRYLRGKTISYTQNDDLSIHVKQYDPKDEYVLVPRLDI